ncbi:hypothetical protein M3Y97_01050200 [Aphelenchoides bicaudatus]|nr:hypothetical protein M3Y97_01050200 [Aphelenchoides bicaudatus]
MPTKFVDPQNMYVFDKNYFANETYVVFNNSVYGLVHLSLCVMFPLLGIMVSSLTIYLSIWRNPAHFKSFSRIVLISAVVDLFYAGSDFWCQPRYQGSSSAILFSFTGPVSLLDYKVQCYSHCFKRMVQTLVFMILPAQHMLRYQILKTNSMPPLTYTLVYASICVAVSLFSFGVTAAAFCTFENPGSVDFGPLWYKENPIPVLLVASTTLVPLLTFVIPFFLPRICVYLDIKVGYYWT